MTIEAVVETAVELAKNHGWGLAVAVAPWIWSHRTRLWNAGACAGPLRFKSVRVSAAYLIRIEIDGEYLLVRGNRIKDQFQPVGGVYKYVLQAQSRLDRLGVRTDKAIPLDQDSKNDLRVRVPGKNIPSFLRWFDGGCDRESGPWREFFEELVAPGLVGAAAFPYAYFRWVKRHESTVHWSPEFQTWEILVADVFELVPSPEQEAELRRLRAKTGKDHVFATEKRLGVRGFQAGAVPEDRIAPTAEWML